MAKIANKEAPPESEELVKGILEWLALARGHSEDAEELLQQLLSLREAAIGVAVSSADRDVQAVADHVVASNDDDGVAEALDMFASR